MIEKFTILVTRADTFTYLLWQSITVVAAVFLAVLAFRKLRWWRTIEDVPTSKARSATQGYVELNGQAEIMDGEPVRAPVSGRECAWWSLLVEKYDGEKWRKDRRDVSDALFHLRDDTGVCIIDPDDAVVTTPHKYVSRDGGVKFRGINVGARYRYTERLVLHYDPLYVLGQFQTHNSADNWDSNEEAREKLGRWKRDQAQLLARFDADADGRIDQQEWAQARAAARAEVSEEHRQAAVRPGVNVVGAPPDKRPFLIAVGDESELTRRLRLHGLLATAGLAISATIAVAMLAIRI